MKRLLIIGAMLAGITTLNAQTTAMGHGKWEENDDKHHKATSGSVNEFVSTEMSVNNNVITFTDLPTVKRATYAILTNANGDFIKQTKISPEQNVMELSKLHGGLYFVTIVYKNQSKKAFTLNL